MKAQSNSELSQLLSSFVDGELDQDQRRDVEDLVSRSPEARKELEELKALRGLLAAKKVLPPSVGFWTRLSTELDRRKREEENLLPFPRRYVPHVAIATTVVVVVIGIALIQQRSSVVEFVNRQSERVQQAVSDNFVKGSLMPLLSHVDKNQALQFAMFGTLPLDAKAETQLRVNQDSASGYSIDVDKKSGWKVPAVTVKDFVDEVKPTNDQLEIIDSLLDLGRQKIEASVFVAQDRAMIVSPQLSRFNRVMLSGIAACLDQPQQVRFERFLRTRSAPYTITSGIAKRESSARILQTMQVSRGPDHFFVVTPDTVMVSRMEIDMDSLRQKVEVEEKSRDRMWANVDGLIRRIGERNVAMAPQVRVRVPQMAVRAPQFRIVGDSESFSIQIANDWDGMPAIPPDIWVKPRTSVQVGFGDRRRPQSVDFNFNGVDTAFNLNVDFDSIVSQMQREGNGLGIQFFRKYSRPGGQGFEMRFGHLTPGADSEVLAKRHLSPKLDSLMRVMEQREKLREQQMKTKVPRE